MSELEIDDLILARVAERVGETRAPSREDGARAAPDAQAVLSAGAEKPRTGWNLPGILGQTHVSTTFGEVPAQLVRRRDRLRTKDGDYLPVHRIDEYKIDHEFLLYQPDAKPIVVKAGSMAGSAPSRDAFFSPGQRILRQTSGVKHVLVTARDVSSLQYALDRSVGQLSYYVFHLGRTAMIRCEGMWVQMDKE